MSSDIHGTFGDGAGGGGCDSGDGLMNGKSPMHEEI